MKERNWHLWKIVIEDRRVFFLIVFLVGEIEQAWEGALYALRSLLDELAWAVPLEIILGLGTRSSRVILNFLLVYE